MSHKPQCVFYTIRGEPCKNPPAIGEPACNVHLLQIESITCIAITKAGSRCKNHPQKGRNVCGPHINYIPL